METIHSNLSKRESSRTATALPEDFRVLLQSELIRRSKANPAFSMRAFARQLKIGPSRLSKILKGQRPIRPELIDELGQKLGLSLEDIQRFKTRYQKKKHQLKALVEPERSYAEISLDTFEIISDWQHYAILELMKVEGFDPSPKWLARALGVQVNVVQAYVERLCRAGLLKVSESGEWKDASEGYSTDLLGPNHTSYAHRQFQEQVLQQALQALHEVSVERRDHTSMMMATHSDRIVEAKSMIKTFRRQLCEFLEAAPVKNSVYQLGVALFPVANAENDSVPKKGKRK